MDNIFFHYELHSDDRLLGEFRIDLDPNSLERAVPPGEEFPAWTALTYCQCENCPLLPAIHRYCPLAVALEPLVHRLGDMRSTQHLQVRVHSRARRVHFEAQAQDVVGSLMGLVIATSGCPHTNFLKPMARYHQPYADMDETFYRVASMYRLAQYYRKQKGFNYDRDFDGLKRLYGQVRVVNRGIKARILAATCEDATINAIAVLDALAMLVSMSLEDELKIFQHTFSAYTQTDVDLIL